MHSSVLGRAQQQCHTTITTTNNNSTPYFDLQKLSSGIGYNVFLIAQNAKGRSNSTIRQVFTLSNPQKQTDTSSLLAAATPTLANLKTLLPFLLFGCAGAIALTAIIVVFVIRKRANRNGNSTNDVMGDQSTGGNSDRCETAAYALSTQRTLQSSQEVARDLCADSNESMEKNPDIIPQGKIHFLIVFFLSFFRRFSLFNLLMLLVLIFSIIRNFFVWNKIILFISKFILVVLIIVSTRYRISVFAFTHCTLLTLYNFQMNLSKAPSKQNNSSVETLFSIELANRRKKSLAFNLLIVLLSVS